MLKTFVQYAVCLRLVGGREKSTASENALAKAQDLRKASATPYGWLRWCQIFLAVAKADYDGALALFANIPLASASPKTIAEYQLLCAERTD